MRRIGTLVIAAACAAMFGGAAVAAAPAAPWQDRYVETDPGVRIHVISAGQASAKPPLVLIPGWRFSGTVWREQIETFSKERQVISLDPRSQGDSTKTAEGDTPEVRAKDLRTILNALHVGKFVLVGWSQGVQDTAAYVQQFGVADLEGIVLVDSTISRGFQAASDPASGAADQLRSASLVMRYPRESMEGMLQAIILQPQRPEDRQALVETGMKTPPAIAAAMVVNDLLGQDRTPAIAKMTVPTLVIASGYSPELKGQQAMAAALPHGRFVAVEKAGHVVFVDQPAAFDLLLKAFLVEIDMPAAAAG